MPIQSLGYVRVRITDVTAWRTFMGDFLGLMEVAGNTNGALSYRMDEYPARFVLEPDDRPALSAVGWEVLDRRDLDLYATKLERVGIRVESGTDERRQERQVTDFIRFEDTNGNPVELFYGPIRDFTPLDTPKVSRFVTGDQGCGHVILSCGDTEAAYELYVGVLGFEERNTLDIPGLGRYYFLGCNPRQHSLGLSPGQEPGLDHFMVEAATLDDVGRALDRADDHKVPMMQSLGRHTNDRMVSFYVYSPDGHQVEFGFDGMRVDGRQAVYAITDGAFWGHKFTPMPGSGADDADASRQL